MLRFSLITVLILLCPMLLAEDLSWPLDSVDSPELSVHGDVSAAAGAEGNSVVFDGTSLLKVKDSERLTSGENGFTLTAWVNPYLLSGEQQMIAAKNRYSLGERQWGVMIDEDNRFRLYVYQGRWETAGSSIPPRSGHWHLIGVVIRSPSAELWVNGKLAGQVKLTKPIPQTKAPLTFGGVDDNGRIWQNFVGALDEVRLVDKPLDAKQMAAAYKPVTATHNVPEPRQPFTLWTGAPIPSDVEQIPFAEGIKHSTIHRPADDGYRFLHGAAIVEHKGVMYANWANSPTDENGPHETLQGRRSTDDGLSWSELEVIGPGFEGGERHSHGVLFVHKGEVWTICARFGVGTPGRRFPGLQAEAFVLDEQTDRWKSRGIVMKNCWPYDEPVRMDNGNFITGGQDKDGLPVVAISHGDDLTKWDSVLIPYHRQLQPSFAETTVWFEGGRVTAVIRGSGGVAWVSTSDDYGRTWTKARASNLPMPRAKAYLGKLSTGQLYLVSNLKNRDTLVVSVSRPGESTLSSMWRIRHGKSDAPRFPGRAKSKQWSYPYGYEHQGKLYVVYSVGKEECGLTTVPVKSLVPRPQFELGTTLPAFKGLTSGVNREIDMPLVDLSADKKRHAVVAAGTKSVYQGHCDTVLLPDGKTMFTAWCLGHARWIGPIARSTDAGLTWSKPLDVPDNWKETSNTPTLHRLFAPDGTARLFCFADGLDWSRQGKPPYPMHQSYSEDKGKTWTPMVPNGVQGEVPPKTIHAFDNGKRLVMWSDLPGYVVQSESLDGGLTWSRSRRILRVPSRWSQPCVIRSVDGKTHLMLLRENSRKYRSLFSVSHDHANTWTEPRELPTTLTGDRHAAKFAPDGRLVVAFRDVAKSSSTYGHYVAWIGRFEDILAGKPGDYRIKLFHNTLRKESDKPGQGNADCGYSDLEVLPDGTIIATTYLKYAAGPEKHSVMNTRFTLAETDALAKDLKPPHPKPNPDSPIMLSGSWLPKDSHQLDFKALPRVPSKHVVISDVRAKGPDKQNHKKGGVNQHNYLAFHDGRFWAMWSDGPSIEDRVGQVVKYATSDDGLKWAEPQFLTPYPPNSNPDSPHYDTRSKEGMRWIARGFWKREGELLALASLDEAAGFFGPRLELRALRFNKKRDAWENAGLIYKNAINNFPPKKLRTGDWLMSRRPHNYSQTGVHFLVGGVNAIDDWKSYPVLGSASELKAEEPGWWILPDNSLSAIFRDNRRSGYIYRAFSTDDGRTWSKPVKTNFPDATSKMRGIRLSDGRYVLVSNSNPKARNPLTLAISPDGLVFTKLVVVVDAKKLGYGWIDYPDVMEHEGSLYIAFAGSKGSVNVLKVKLSDVDAAKMPTSPLFASEKTNRAVHGADKEPVFVSLFDGKSFTGWKHGGNWVIEDGAFFRKKSGGSLTYTKSLVPDDFELRFEWKVSKGCNSGVYYRPAQYEYQILDNVHSAYGENPRQAAGSLFFCMAPSKDVTKPFGQWNSGRVKCKGTVIEHWVNGERVLSFDYTDPKWAKQVKLLKIRGADLNARGGRLWLQDHGQDVWFRNLRWREIPGEEELAADPDFVPMPVTGQALRKEQDRVKRMVEAQKKKQSQ